MNIALGCDEAGFDLKQIIAAKLKELGHSIEDYGCYDKNPVLYPDIGRKVAEAGAWGWSGGVCRCWRPFLQGPGWVFSKKGASYV